MAQTQTRPPSAGWVLLLGTPVCAWHRAEDSRDGCHLPGAPGEVTMTLSPPELHREECWGAAWSSHLRPSHPSRSSPSAPSWLPVARAARVVRAATAPRGGFN